MIHLGQDKQLKTVLVLNEQVSAYLRLIIFTALLTMLFIEGCGYSEEIDPSKKSDLISNISNASALSVKERLGKLLFFEESLSTPPGQACSECHAPEVAFADPEWNLPVSKGALPGLYGNRNDMTVSYSVFVPPLHFDKEEGIWIGGLFWDGRVNSLAEQAQGPPLNPLEMANPDTVTIAEKLNALSYREVFIEVYGTEALKNPAVAFNNMADAIAAYEKTSEVNPFSSKYDRWLSGDTQLSSQEIRGLTHIPHIEIEGGFPFRLKLLYYKENHVFKR